MDAFLQILQGGASVFTEPMSLVFLSLGFFIGIIFGSLPGLTATLAIVLLLPMTYSLPLSQALVMCAGVYMAGTYSGCISAITINIPGAPASMMTNLEGYPMMRRGEGAKAIGSVTIGSAIGGTIGSILLILVAPITMELALKIRTPGKGALIFFALVVVSLLSDSKAKGLISLVFGCMLATIGMDVLSSASRFTFQIPSMLQGIELTTIIIGAFALSEMLAQSTVNNAEYKERVKKANTKRFKRKDFFPTFKEMKEIGFRTYIKSSLIGYIIGVLPGSGASMAAFVSYAEAKRSSKHPEKYGKGYSEGMVAAETANNAVCGGALIPMLSLGIPGDGVTAVVLGVLMIYGIVPGPTLLTQQMGDIAPMFIALLISAAVLLPLSLFLFGPLYLKIAGIPRMPLYSSIGLIAILGVYASTLDFFQMAVALIIGVLMYFLGKQNYPKVPFILGVILGPLFELYLRTAMSLSNGNPMIFLTSPDSLFFLLLTLFFAIFLPRVNKKSHDKVIVKEEETVCCND
ncbi:tricarboxylate transporter [Oceanispirochaeta crateris]|uniref:Tricarboxylate transporter n=1 Tax=Oceanispirochaeta crateris TaxID=2518645 RepID=A0A5C1QUA6_9SPIO|nr:tripartite tricarboxylate transporter permease [Oceanispirochaeta crateris]QEN09642.1 tricarboxylate transporter [Oceanispirochaeta crateris]